MTNQPYKERSEKELLNQAKRARKWQQKMKLAIHSLLGGECVKCGFNDSRALQIDHINGGGAKEVRTCKGTYLKFVLEKILSGSKDYQLLCANCNWIKRFENKEVRGK